MDLFDFIRIPAVAFLIGYYFGRRDEASGGLFGGN